MAQYRAIADLYPGANWPYIPAGTTFSDVAGASNQMVPPGWTPSAVDPVDQAGIQNFFNVGPQFFPSPKLGVAPPVIYWTPYAAGGGTRPMILTGAGAALGFQNWLNTRGALP